MRAGESFGPPPVMCRLVEETRAVLVGLPVETALPQLVRFCNATYHRGTGGPLHGSRFWRRRGRMGRPGTHRRHEIAGILGGHARDTVVPYASAGYVVLDDDLSANCARPEAHTDGFRAVKIKIGTGLSADLERIGAAREVLGPDRELMVDVNGTYTIEEAADLCRELAHLPVAWLEETPGSRGRVRAVPAPPSRCAPRHGRVAVHPPSFPAAARPAPGGRDPARRHQGGGVRSSTWHEPGWSGCPYSLGRWGRARDIPAAPRPPAGFPNAAHVTSTPWLEFDRVENGLRDKLLTTPIQMEVGLETVPDGLGIGVGLDEDYMNEMRMDR